MGMKDPGPAPAGRSRDAGRGRRDDGKLAKPGRRFKRFYGTAPQKNASNIKGFEIVSTRWNERTPSLPEFLLRRTRQRTPG
jgi:hypothetical protein